MPVVKDEISLVKVANGDDGRGILGTPVATYAQSTSGTIPPTTWSATRPNVPAGQYLWTRVVTTYTDNTTSETQTPTLMGAEGESGLGIKDKSISYAAGTSGNTPPTSGWQETIPTVSANQYLWTKTTLVYTDDTKTDAYSVGKMGANGADAKLLYLTASAENMAFNADDTPKTTQTINISAKLQNVTGTATFTAIPYIGNTAQTAITLGGTGNTRTLTSAQWNNKDWTLIAITATLDNLSDTVSIVKVKDGAKGDKGSDGIAGKDGVGVSDTTITYAQSSNGTNPPSTGWTASVPTLIKGQYLWTKTVWSYTDSTTETGYTVSYNAKDGNDGDDGIAGKDGVGISATKIEYVGSTSGTVKPSSGWSTTIPAVPEGSFLWTKTTWSYTDNTTEVGYSVAKMGAKGDKGSQGDQGPIGPKGDPGNQGIPGTPGVDGKTPYTHWAYAWSADGTDRFTTQYPNENYFLGSQTTKIGDLEAVAGSRKEYQTLNIGSTWVDNFESGDRAIISFDIVMLKGLQLQIYNTNRKGPFTFTNKQVRNIGTEKTRIEVNVELTKRTDATLDYDTIEFYSVYDTSDFFEITNVKIEKAESAIDTATIYTPAPSDDFANAYPTFAGTYIDYEPTDSEDPTKYTWQRILGESGQDGKDGEDGANGQDAKEVISGYLSNDSIIVPANASGTVTDFTKALGDFIIYEGQTKVSSGVTYSKVSETGMTSTINSAGRYTVTALSADVGTATYQAVYKAVTIQKIMIVVKNKQGATGPAGSNGTDGKGIVSSATTYQAGTSGTTPPTGTWSTSIASVSENQYLWTKIVLTYSDNTNSTAYSVGKMGAKGETGSTGSTGATGATGNGIKSTTINFASSTSGTTAPSSGWTTSIPTVAAGSFLWTRTVLTFTDNTTNTSYTVAKQGEKGDPTGIISQSTVPTNPYVGMLWQNTGASGYIIGATYQWNGSKFNLYIFTADNIVATTLSAITANLGNITAGNISGVTISGSKFINSGTTTIDGNEMDYTTTLEGSYESEWKLKASNLNGRLIINPTILASSAWNDIPKNEPAWAWSVSNAGIYTARAGTRSNTSLSNNASYGPDGITMASELYASTYGNVFLSYLDLLTINPTLLNPAANFETYSNAWIPTAKRTVGRVITLSGAFKNNVILPSADETVMGYVPEWAYPTQDINFRVNGSGINTFLLKIKSNGQITISRYGTTSMINVPIGAWLNLSCVYSAS